MSDPVNPKAKGPIAVWQEPQVVRFGVIDRSDRLTMDAVFQMFQEAAISHAENLGVGREDMARTGQVWILSRMSVQIDRRPGYGEAVTVRSWPRGGEKLFALRDFDVLDAANSPVVRARSGWIILDKEKRRPLRPKSVMDALPLNNGLDALPSGAAELEERANLKKVMDRKALYSDVDYNGHVNNVKYIQWIEDALASQHLEKAGQMRLDINYLTEVLPGENIALWTAPFTEQPAKLPADQTKPDAPDTPPPAAAYAIEGRKDGGVPAFRAELRLWEGAAPASPKKYAKKMGNPFMKVFGNIDKDRLNIILAIALLLSLAINILLGVRSCSSSSELNRLRQVEQEWLASEEARLEAERLAAEEAARLEAERFEAERLAAEEAARLAAEEEARLEAERLAAEEAARRRGQQPAPRPQPAAQYASTESNPGNAFVGTWANENKSIVFRFRNNGSLEILNFNIVDELVTVTFRENRAIPGGGFYRSANPVATESIYTGTGKYAVNGDEVTFNLNLKSADGAAKDFSHKTKFFFENSNKTLKLANGIPRKFRISRQTRQEVTHERSRDYFSTAFIRQ
jgi:acyl-ACP thioesterase